MTLPQIREYRRTTLELTPHRFMLRHALVLFTFERTALAQPIAAFKAQTLYHLPHVGRDCYQLAAPDSDGLAVRVAELSAALPMAVWMQVFELTDAQIRNTVHYCRKA